MRNLDVGMGDFDGGGAWVGGTTLIVGSCTPMMPRPTKGSATGTSTHLETVEWHDLDQLMLTMIEPDLVVSPLVSDDFDCVDLAFRLTRLGYRGRYVALTEGLPHPAIVRREVRSLCPHLDFDIVETRQDRRRLQ